MSRKRSGSVFFALFSAVVMVGILGASTVNLLTGPVRAMGEVTRRTIAETSLIGAGKLAIISADAQNGDCDADGAVEPLEWLDPAGKPAPVNGGLLPVTIGASLMDPWGNHYGYCAWDHGTDRLAVACGNGANRLSGSPTRNNIVLAVISSGPDRMFQTLCNNEGEGDYVVKASGSDDLVMRYTYQEAEIMSGGLWRLKEDDSQTAEIKKNLSVQDESGAEQMSFDAQTKELAIASGGTGALPNIKTDFVQPLSSASVEFLSNIKLDGAWLSGDGSDTGIQVTLAGDVNTLGKLNISGAAIVTNTAENDVGIEALASGLNSIGVRAGGTSKAIEAHGVIDAMDNKIVQVAAPTEDSDAATKKYVDDKFVPVKSVKCDAFVFSGCSGGTTTNLTTASLGDCKKACEDAGVQCCAAQYGTLAGNPNATLSQCVGHSGGKPNASLVNLLAALIFPANIGAYCYEQH